MLLWCGLSYAFSLNCSQQCPAIQFLSPAMGGRGKEGKSSACIHSDHWEQPGYLQGESIRDSFPAPHQGAALGPGLWKLPLEPTYPVHGDPPLGLRLIMKAPIPLNSSSCYFQTQSLPWILNKPGPVYIMTVGRSHCHWHLAVYTVGGRKEEKMVELLRPPWKKETPETFARDTNGLGFKTSVSPELCPRWPVSWTLWPSGWHLCNEGPVLQRIYTHGQQAHEKLLNIISRWGNANRNHSGIPSHTYQDDHNEKDA